MSEFISYMSLSAVLKQAGHEVAVFVDSGGQSERMQEQLRGFEPDLIGFSLMTASVAWALEQAGRIKRWFDGPIIVGGVHAHIDPEFIRHPQIDIQCIGEGEYVLRDLADCLSRGDAYDHLPGLSVKRNGQVIVNPAAAELIELDQLPYLDQELYAELPYFRERRSLVFKLGRGCPFRCAFCANAVDLDLFGPRYVRKMSPQRAIAEIEHAVARHQPREVRLHDENLWNSNAWLREFLQLYKARVNLPYAAAFRFGPIQEADVRLLGEAGKAYLIFAVECADEEERRSVLNKQVSNAHIVQAAEWLRRYNVTFCATALFGLPGETVAARVRDLAFYRRLGAGFVSTAFISYLPGAAISTQPAVRDALLDGVGFGKSFHREMSLDLPERLQLTNLKKVYNVMVRYPAMQRPLLWLTRFPIPVLFDLIFLVNYYFGFDLNKVGARQALKLLWRYGLSEMSWLNSRAAKSRRRDALASESSS
ncbi:putative radical SAM domain-containing protein [Magnetofaba australis IT-1]|uniref:Putative radical SAM domain-containing protein n=1 Tax=Magnetofaba australis IT-1 TaxID=1434232 RepID=A0A1Y2K1K4_9PROT|nr:putative radical SAM domain-containing protein [Magnetofaba australis IT-1]